MTYRPSAECFAAANEASGKKLSEADINEAFQAVADEKERLKASGQTDRMAERLQKFAEDRAEKTRIAAALQKRHEALNILVRDRLEGTVKALTTQGLKSHEALLAIMEGTQKGVEGGRASVDAMKMAFRGRYVGDMLAQMVRERPHLEALLADKHFDNDVLREMAELRDGGKPGITNNPDARYAAKVFATFAEMSRTELNRLGASIGKLDGWAGAQTHDDIKMIAAGKDKWVAAIKPLLDEGRTFTDAAPEEIDAILGDVYDTIVTGISGKPIERPVAGRVNPANLAKSLGKSRVLHFKDAESAMAYRDQFGYGTTIQGIIAHQDKAASLAAQMETFGPNPENMLQSMIDRMSADIRKDANLSPSEKAKQVASLRFDGGTLRAAFDIMSGMASRPVNTFWAKFGSETRALQAMAKLGGAVISSMPADIVTQALAQQFRGGGFWRSITDSLGGILKGRPEGEAKEIAYLMNEGWEGLIGHINSAAAGHDMPMGKMAALQEKFFRFNGMAWWDTAMRSTAARAVGAEMGMRAETAFEDLPKAYQRVLGMHGIGAEEWNAVRQAGARIADGRSYITGDRMRSLSDEAVRPLIETDLAKLDLAKAEGKLSAGAYEKRVAELHDKARFDLEMKVRAFVADETRYGVIQTDARSRRTTTWGGLRPGTFAGEVVRFIMQFKGFPIAFGQRVIGRALRGFDANSRGEQIAHVASIISGLGAAGYMAMVAKDAMKGNWPPRNPLDPKVAVAAFQQGGALGIYGDYLFGQSSRFGNSALETAAGPVAGTISSVINTALTTRDYAFGKLEGGKSASPAAQWISLLQGNTPFANLFYTKWALDYMVLNSVRDWATPGHTAKAAHQRFKDYGQTTWGAR